MLLNHYLNNVKLIIAISKEVNIYWFLKHNVPLKMGRSNVAFKREYEKHIKDIRSEFN
jgi:hypothetical protein